MEEIVSSSWQIPPFGVFFLIAERKKSKKEDQPTLTANYRFFYSKTEKLKTVHFLNPQSYEGFFKHNY